MSELVKKVAIAAVSGPKALGAYSPAILVEGKKTLFVSGQLGLQVTSLHCNIGKDDDGVVDAGERGFGGWGGEADQAGVGQHGAHPPGQCCQYGQHFQHGTPPLGCRLQPQACGEDHSVAEGHQGLPRGQRRLRRVLQGGSSCKGNLSGELPLLLRFDRAPQI